MADEVGPTSIASRIAALKLNQVGRGPQSQPQTSPQSHPSVPTTRTSNKGPPPALPTRRTESTHCLPTTTGVGNQPAAAPPKVQEGKPPPTLPARRPTSNNATPTLPPRRTSESPSLPPRRPSEALVPSVRTSDQYSRRGSRESIASTVSNFSIASNKTGVSSKTSAASGPTYNIRAPSFDAAKLPPLPPKRANDSTSSIPSSKASTPSLPQRPALPQRQSTVEQSPKLPTRTQTQTQTPRKSALLQGFSQGNEKQPALPNRPNRESASSPELPQLPQRPQSVPQEDQIPPPIPTASRPDLATLKLSKPKVSAGSESTASNTGSCLRCRDFSGPDTHATRFPRESIPSLDPAWLAHQLADPFPSHTDKARVIFVWLHQNIAYNTVAFFNNAVRSSTPNSTLSTGLAVCEGYAALFTCMATHVGLESRVIGGHGKGFGYKAVGPGEPVPPYSSGHAWNVVRIDNGDWKLCDPCWGAGNVSGGSQGYNKHFNPSQFTMSNEDFGDRHFPEDRKSFYRADGRYPTWEEYLLGADRGGAAVHIFSGFTWEEGVAEKSILPRPRKLSLAAERQKGAMVRFSFTKVCPHWDNEVRGKGKHYCYILCRDGYPAIPFQHNGYAWWLDIPSDELGLPEKNIKIAAVNSFKGGDGRGVTGEEFRAGLGRVAMGWGFVCKWDLVP